MKVAIDVTTLGAESVSGVGFHIIRLLESLDPLIANNENFELFYESPDSATSKRVHERLGHLNNMNLNKVPFLNTKLGTLHRLKNKYLVPWLVSRKKCDVFHGPSHTFASGITLPSVVTMHDLAVFRHDLYEESFNIAVRNAMSSSMKRADVIIALSEYTKQEIKDITGREDNVHVVYGAGNYADDADRIILDTDDERLRELGITKPYIFYIGDFGVRKNIPYLIESYKELLANSDTNDVQLVLAGNSKPVLSELNAQITKLGLNPKQVVFPGRVSDADLKILYRNANVFCLASLGEGFTLVTLEAMSYGVPVVATNTTSIAEGTGDAAELGPVDDKVQFAKHLHIALTDTSRREEMIASGLERYKQFTWEKNARRTLELYQLAANSK